MTRKYSAVIVEDEPGDAELLKAMLERYSQIKCCGQAADITKARNLILEIKPDVLFLDVDLHGRSVFELLDKLEPYKLNSYLIFTTAHSSYALESYNYSAMHYLIKPIVLEDLDAAIDRMVRADMEKTPYLHNIKAAKEIFSKIIIEQGSKDYYVSPSEILYVRTVTGQSYTEVFLTAKPEKPFIVSKGLGEFETKLLARGFLKVHRSITINPAHLTQVNASRENSYIVLKDVKIQVSTAKSRELRKYLRDMEAEDFRYDGTVL